MKNKKGDMFFDVSFLVVMIFVLMILVITIHVKTTKLTNEVGQLQKNILDTYHESEKTLLFIDQSAKYSVQQSIFDLGQKGGFQIIPECKTYQGYTLWNKEDKTCFPEIKKSFYDFMEINLNNYFNNQLTIPKNNYDFLLKEENNKAVIYGFATMNLGFDIKGRKLDKNIEIETTPTTTQTVRFNIDIRDRNKWVRSLSDDGKVTPAFLEKTKQIANSLGADYVDLLSIMYFETSRTLSPTIQNPHSDAIGLIQFLPSTAKSMLSKQSFNGRSASTNDEAITIFKSMSAIEQLDYVQLYFEQFSRADYSNPTHVSLAVFYPNAIGQPPNHILFSKPDRECKSSGEKNAYCSNSGLDINPEDNHITVLEYTAPSLRYSRKT